jgi:hypothetical protein
MQALLSLNEVLEDHLVAVSLFLQSKIVFVVVSLAQGG